MLDVASPPALFARTPPTPLLRHAWPNNAQRCSPPPRHTDCISPGRTGPCAAHGGMRARVRDAAPVGEARAAPSTACARWPERPGDAMAPKPPSDQRPPIFTKPCPRPPPTEAPLATAASHALARPRWAEQPPRKTDEDPCACLERGMHTWSGHADAAPMDRNALSMERVGRGTDGESAASPAP